MNPFQLALFDIFHHKLVRIQPYDMKILQEENCLMSVNLLLRELDTLNDLPRLTSCRSGYCMKILPQPRQSAPSAGVVAGGPLESSGGQFFVLRWFCLLSNHQGFDDVGGCLRGFWLVKSLWCPDEEALFAVIFKCCRRCLVQQQSIVCKCWFD